MSEPVALALVLLAGLGLGILFYGGLWMTVRSLPASAHPAALVLGSFWGRTAFVVAGFLLLTARRWQNAAACMVGFVIGRVLLTHWIPVHGGPRHGI